MIRRNVLKFMLAVCALGISGTGFAQAGGPGYTRIDPPQPGSVPGKIEVIEFFSYMCPHCYQFEPLVSKWQQTLPKNVVFRKVPIVFRANWEDPARLFLALDAMGEANRLNGAVFDAIHKNNVDFSNEQVRIAWVTKQGIDARKFSDVWKSFSVDSQMQRSKQMGADYQVSGVPSIAIGGRYMATSEGGFDSLLRNANALIAKVQAELGK